MIPKLAEICSSHFCVQVMVTLADNQQDRAS